MQWSRAPLPPRMEKVRSFVTSFSVDSLKECALCMHKVFGVEDIRCDTCGVGGIWKAAWEFLPIN